MALVLLTMRSWPQFVMLEEYLKLMSDQWQAKYHDKRVIFWDDTNVGVPSSSDAEVNRHTFSAYYAGMVAKGAVFLQLCCWMGSWELLAGAISDTEYQT
jgi:hypothetical protein